MLLLDSALHVVDGEPLPEPDEGPGPSAEQLEAAAHRHAAGAGEVDVSELRYEVMYFLDLDDAADRRLQAGVGRASVIRSSWSAAMGCGTATFTPTTSVSRSRSRSTSVGDRARSGSPTCSRRWPTSTPTAKLRSMPRSMGSAAGIRRSPATRRPCRPSPVRWSRSPAAVASSSCSATWACRVVVTGGQTLNPSTAELLAAVEAVNAEQVVVLPNNKNIIPVAEQLDALTSKRVLVVPTRSMPEALASLVVYDPEADVDANAAEMADAASSVATGEVTQAVRDTNSPAGPIVEGDWIGLVRGDGIVAVGRSVAEVSIDLLGQLVTAGREIVTIVTGIDAVTADTDSIAAWLRDQLPQIEIEVHHGGQPLYPYLFGGWSEPVGAMSQPPSTPPGSTPSGPPPGPLSLRDLDAIDVGRIRGVGERKLAGLREVGISTVLDLVTFYPRRWVDRTNEARVSDLEVGKEALVLVTVRNVTKRVTKNRKNDGDRGRRRRQRSTDDHVLQPAVAREAAGRGTQHLVVRQARGVPRWGCR